MGWPLRSFRRQEDAPYPAFGGEVKGGVIRVALAPGTIGGGGIGKAALGLAEGMRDLGVAVDLLVQDGPAPGRPVPEGVALHGLPRRGRAALPAALAYLRRARPDMVVTSRGVMHLTMLAAHRLSGLGPRCRMVWSVHTHRSAELARAGRKYRAVEAAVGRLIGRADGVVAVSDGVAADLAATTRLARAQIRVIANPAWRHADAALAAAPCPHPWLGVDGPPVILGIGRLVAQKDFATLIDAVARLRRSRPVRLMILGEGPQAGELQARAARLGLAGAVAFAGHVANPLAYLSRAALFVLSSRWEGAPVVLVEALGCGCPIVATDCPSGPAEILRGGLGTLVGVGDAAALAAAMAARLDAPRGSDALRGAAQAYGPRKAAQAYLSLAAPALRPRIGSGMAD